MDAGKATGMHRDQPGQDASFSTNRPPFHEKQPGRRGRSAGTIRGDRKRSAPVAADNCEPGDLPSVPGIVPILGRLPAASTEVVLAEGFYSALPLAVRMRGAGMVRSASYAEYAVPPSVLPDISPTRGEIESRRASPETTNVGWWSRSLSISPLVGEMSGRTEGGATPSTTEKGMRVISLAFSPRGVRA